ETQHLALAWAQRRTPRRALRMARVEGVPALDHRPQRLEELLDSARLENASLRIHVTGRLVEAALQVGSHQDGRLGDAEPAQIADELSTTPVGKAVVGEQKLGPPALPELDGLGGARRLAGQAELRSVQREPHPAAHHRVVFDEEDRDLGRAHAASLSSSASETNALVTAGSNCVPAPRSISATATSKDSALR